MTFFGTWTDQVVETRDHVNLMYFSLFWISVLKSVRLPDICIFDEDVKFKTLFNRSPLNRPELSPKIMCLCAHTQENRKFLLPKSKHIVYLNNIFGWKRFLSFILCVFSDKQCFVNTA